MSAVVSLPSRPEQRPAEESGIAFRTPANDDRLSAEGAIFGPEVRMNVSFVGLSPEEVAFALASFPGARRCVLVA